MWRTRSTGGIRWPTAGGQFCFPPDVHDQPIAYFCGNSLGLQPAGAGRAVDQELEDWSRLAVDAHFEGRTPWFSYHEALRDPSARLVGAAPVRGRRDERADHEPAPDAGLVLTVRREDGIGF